MIKKTFVQSLLKLFLMTVFACATFLQSGQAAIDGGVGRVRTCSPTGAPDGLDYNPFNGGKDVEFTMSNPVCLAVVANAYALVKVNVARMNAACGSGSSMPRFTPSPILDTIDIGRGTIKAISTRNPQCGFQVATASTSFVSAIAIISVIYGIARNVYDNSEICGSHWMGPSTTQYINSTPNYKAQVEDAIFGTNGYIANNRLDQLTFDNQIYREWYYGGIEVENKSCPDVMAAKRTDGLFPPQKYYMKGLETANYNCKKYDILPGQGVKDPRDGSILTAARLAEFRYAYDCCKTTAREYACVKYNDRTEFCKAGSLCAIKGITFSAKPVDNGRLVCVETYSLCPYNFTLGGGAEKCDFWQDGIYNSGTGNYDYIDVASVTSGDCTGKSEIRNADCTYNARAGRCKNYCQFMTHCTKTDLSDYQYSSSITSPYFSSACLNFVGDSQNVISFGTGFIAGSARHFSAPIAQCTKETIENIFYNRAGHTACRLITDTPSNNSCPNGTLYKKGDNIMAQSFFSNLQDKMRFIVKMVLTLSITFFGTKLLLGGGIKKSEILMYALKIGLVLYFATGEAWQTMFFDGIYSASTVFSQIVFKVEASVDKNKRDGCQFGNVTLADGTKITQSHYPVGKEYLAIWDTLDCKITRYLGFGPELSTANIAKLILAGFITPGFLGPIGVYFSIALLFFGLILIANTIRALHIFLSSCIAIILMVYVSPLIIPLALFEKTKGIFRGWVTQLISFSLQPMILFAYIAIFITLMDKTLIGSATFYGVAPSRAISCSQYCQDASGQVVNGACDLVGQKMVIPKADSVACMISSNSFGNWPGLELFGISLPFLIDFFADHTREKILTIAKAVLVMYFLLTFMDEIPGISSQLLGGATLPSSKISAMGMYKKIGGALLAIQERAKRATIKWGAEGAGGAINAVKKVMEAGDKGKEVSSKGEGEGADEAGDSGGGDDDPGKAKAAADKSEA